MQIEVFLTSNGFRTDDVKGKVAVFVDVLRTSSTIVAALANGAKAVIPVVDMEQANKIASALDPSSYMLAGERDSHKIPGYPLGNSPQDVSSEIIKDKSLILLTTNGTPVIVQAQVAERVYVASFLNLQALAQELISLGKDVVILCAGSRNRIAIEDTLLAGMLVDAVYPEGLPETTTDSARLVWSQYQMEAPTLVSAIHRGSHAQRLKGLGYEADIDFCAQINLFPVVPHLKEGRLLLTNRK